MPGNEKCMLLDKIVPFNQLTKNMPAAQVWSIPQGLELLRDSEMCHSRQFVQPRVPGAGWGGGGNAQTEGRQRDL